jgi:hypothetical protein
MSGWTTGNSNFNSITHLNIGNKSDTRLTNSNVFEFVISTIGQSDTPVWHQMTQVGINRRSDYTGRNYHVTEAVINTNGQSDTTKWHKVVHRDFIITAGSTEVKIPLTVATGGVNMPVEFEGLREHNILEDGFSFNVSTNNATGQVTSKPVEITIPVKEEMVVSGNWRVTVGDYVILTERFAFNTKNYRGAGLASSKPVIVNVPVRERLVYDNQWRNPAQEPVAAGGYRIAGLGTDEGRIIIVDENTWKVEKTQLVGVGSYEVVGLEAGLKTVVGRKVDGESAAYGAVEAVPEQ